MKKACLFKKHEPYKLTYFNVRGRGEAMRYILKDNDIAHEERWVAFGDWPALKSTLLYGQLPVMDFGDGLVLSQSVAIIRHMARENGLYGSNSKEQALIDQLADGEADLREKYIKMIYTNYDDGKAGFLKELPNSLTVFEGLLKSNNGGTGFFVGNKISWADYRMFDLLDNLLVLSSDCLDSFPLLKAFHCRIASRPKLAAYRQTEEFQKRVINGNGKQ